MISGTVTTNREAILCLTIRDIGRQEHPRDAIVDTGFDGWLTLPPDVIRELGLEWQRFGRALLADGSESVFDIYEVVLIWDGQPRAVSIYEMDAVPLVGMSLMYGYEFMLPILDGATFTLRSLTST